MLVEEAFVSVLRALAMREPVEQRRKRVSSRGLEPGSPPLIDLLVTRSLDLAPLQSLDLALLDSMTWQEFLWEWLDIRGHDDLLPLRFGLDPSTSEGASDSKQMGESEEAQAKRSTSLGRFDQAVGKEDRNGFLIEARKEIQKMGRAANPARADFFELAVPHRALIFARVCDDLLDTPAIRAEVRRRERAGQLHSGRGGRGGAWAVFTDAERTARGDSTLFNTDACCLCGWGGNVLCCDSCPAAYHFRCIGVDPQDAEDFESWHCPECLAGGRAQMAGVRVAPAVQVEGTGTLPGARRYILDDRVITVTSEELPAANITYNRTAFEELQPGPGRSNPEVEAGSEPQHEPQLLDPISDRRHPSKVREGGQLDGFQPSFSRSRASRPSFCSRSRTNRSSVGPRTMRQWIPRPVLLVSRALPPWSSLVRTRSRSCRRRARPRQARAGTKRSPPSR